MVGTVVRVTNLSASVTDKQLRDLFGIFGDVLELRLYPTLVTEDRAFSESEGQSEIPFSVCFSLL